MFSKWKSWAKQLKRQIFVLYLAYKDDRSPWFTKLFAVCVVAYAFSPIDLVPDFIPILGYLDDVIIVPLGIMVALRMMPQTVIVDCKIKAEELLKKSKPKNWFVGGLILFLWIVVVVWISTVVYPLYTRK